MVRFGDDGTQYRCDSKAAIDLEAFHCVTADKLRARLAGSVRTLAACSVAGIDLVDWLLRNWLRKSLRLRFFVIAMPHANRLTIHIIAAVAEAVGRTISENTKNALAAAKARGVKLGNPNGARALRGKQTGNAEAVAALKEAATQKAADLKGIVDDIRRSGVTTTRGIAQELHARGIRAPRGDVWHPTAVSRLLTRLDSTTKST